MMKIRTKTYPIRLTKDQVQELREVINYITDDSSFSDEYKFKLSLLSSEIVSELLYQQEKEEAKKK
jgi:hypothetical protein